jgi:curved DNA-binding protein CbpA
MSKPILLIITGCNGSGKSIFSKLLSPSEFTPFDYDLQFLKSYNSLIDSDIKETMAHQMAFNELESQIKKQLKKNLVSVTKPILTPLHFIGRNYSRKTDMIYTLFFCVWIQLAKQKKSFYLGIKQRTFCSGKRNRKTLSRWIQQLKFLF